MQILTRSTLVLFLLLPVPALAASVGEHAGEIWVDGPAEVHGRRFKADFTPVGDDFSINTMTTGTESQTDVVVHDDGRVLVIWTDQEDKAEVTEIRGRLLSQNLIAQGQ